LSWTMPVALITAADGVCHPTSAALISADSADRADVVFTQRVGAPCYY